MPALHSSSSISRELARVGIEAAVARAVRLGCRVCIPVMDSAGHVVSYDRMDGAPFNSAQHARDKAYSSAGNGVATHEMWEYVKDEPQLHIGILKVVGLSVLGGGIPVVHRDQVIGAVGVSGSCGMTEDQAIAETARDAILGGLEDVEDQRQG